MSSPKRISLAILLLLFSAPMLHADSGMLLDWQPISTGGVSLVLTVEARPVTICMITSQGLTTVRMAPTDTYAGNAVFDGPMMVQPFCAIEIYDEAGNRIGRGPYDGRSLLEVEMKPPGYALQLQPNDRISLDRRDREKPFRTVVRLAIYVGRKWKEIVLEKK